MWDNNNVLVLNNLFLYDGWNVVAQLNATNGQPIQTYLWGLDLSGRFHGAGGIGGLLAVNDAAQGVHFVSYDLNGNVTALVNAADGVISARYEYGPFGEPIRASGPMALKNPLRWSTKYWDDETDLVYYGYRYYSPSLGRWLNRDPKGESGGVNLYGFTGNNPVNALDFLGLDTKFISVTTDLNTSIFQSFAYIPLSVLNQFDPGATPATTFSSGVMNAQGQWVMGNLYNVPDNLAQYALLPVELQDVMKGNLADNSGTDSHNATSTSAFSLDSNIAQIAAELEGFAANSGQGTAAFHALVNELGKETAYYLIGMGVGKSLGMAETLLKDIRAARQVLKGKVPLEFAKQGKHIPGHKNYIPGRSRLTYKDPQGLLDKFAGKGQPVGNIPRGQPGFKERVDFGEVIGEVNGQPTTKGIIHYSNDGAHIVPANP